MSAGFIHWWYAFVADVLAGFEVCFSVLRGSTHVFAAGIPHVFCPIAFVYVCFFAAPFYTRKRPVPGTWFQLTDEVRGKCVFSLNRVVFLTDNLRGYYVVSWVE